MRPLIVNCGNVGSFESLCIVTPKNSEDKAAVASCMREEEEEEEEEEETEKRKSGK
jgi:hypothetical protein